MNGLGQPVGGAVNLNHGANGAPMSISSRAPEGRSFCSTSEVPLTAPSERVPGRRRRKFQIPDIGAEAKPDARANWHHDDIVECERRHSQSSDEIGRTVNADETLVDSVS